MQNSFGGSVCQALCCLLWRYADGKYPKHGSAAFDFSFQSINHGWAHKTQGLAHQLCSMSSAPSQLWPLLFNDSANVSLICSSLHNANPHHLYTSVPGMGASSPLHHGPISPPTSEKPRSATAKISGKGDTSWSTELTDLFGAQEWREFAASNWKRRSVRYKKSTKKSVKSTDSTFQ